MHDHGAVSQSTSAQQKLVSTGCTRGLQGPERASLPGQRVSRLTTCKQLVNETVYDWHDAQPWAPSLCSRAPF